MKLLASVRCWPLLWSPPWLIQRPSDQGATSRPGSVSCRSSTRVEARTGSAILTNKEIALFAACLWLARSRSSITPRSMAPNIALAHGIVGAATDQGCCYRARQQARANGLGHDGQGRAIQGTRRACAVNEIAPDTRPDVTVGRANST